MKHLLLFILLVIGVNTYSCFAQTAGTTSTTTLKDRVVGKWAYEGTEEFGVVTPPDSTEKNDWIEFTSDMKYTRLSKGKKEAGVFKVTESTRQIFLTDGATKKTTMYKLKSVTPTGIVLDFQTPDLVHTLYRFKKA